MALDCGARDACCGGTLIVFVLLVVRVQDETKAGDMGDATDGLGASTDAIREKMASMKREHDAAIKLQVRGFHHLHTAMHT